MKLGEWRLDLILILNLRRHQARLLKNESVRKRPIEACALLFGKLTRKEATVTRVVVMPNILRSTGRFEINPQAFFKAFMEAQAEGMEFVGFFHSHPAPASPSTVDLRYMKLWGDAVWLILSQTDEEFAAFRMKADKVEKLTIKVE